MEWKELTDLTADQPFVIERVRMTRSGVAIEGQFDPPQLAQLTIDDQVFVAAFVRCHGSIKEMEAIFGISYPTVKARLTRIAARLEFVEVDPTPPASAGVIDRLRHGELTVAEALGKLEAPS